MCDVSPDDQFHSFFYISAHLTLSFLLWQIPSATWTSPSSTWTWTVSWTWRTSLPTGTQRRSSSGTTAEWTPRRILRARCYDASEFLLFKQPSLVHPSGSLQPQRLLWSSSLNSTRTRSKRADLCKQAPLTKNYNEQTNAGWRFILCATCIFIFILFAFTCFFMFLFICLIWFTCSIAFNVTGGTGNRLPGGVRVLLLLGLKELQKNQHHRTIRHFLAALLPSRLPPSLLGGVALVCGGPEFLSSLSVHCECASTSVFGKCVRACVFKNVWRLD